jgi:hypothetical protein
MQAAWSSIVIKGLERGPGSCIYFPQDQGSAAVPQTLGLPNSITYYFSKVLYIYKACFSPVSVEQILSYQE